MSFKAFITKTTARAKSGVNKVSNTVKLYSQKTTVADELSELFDTLGKMSYYNAIGEGSDTAQEDILNVIEEITRLRKELENIEEDIRNINGKKQCAQCHTELQKDTSFCPHCGAKVEEAPVDEEGEDGEENNQE